MKDLARYRSDFRSVPIADRRGIGALTATDSMFLIKADVLSASSGLRKIRNCSLWRQNIYGQSIKISNRPCCYVIQLKGHHWSMLQYVKIAPIRAIFNREDAQALSRILNTEAVYFEINDISCYLIYFYYNLGSLVESLDYVESNRRGSYYEFYSEVRSLDYEIDGQEAFQITQDFLVSSNIYPIEINWPKWPLLTSEEEVMFNFNGLDKGDVKRADYLVL